MSVQHFPVDGAIIQTSFARSAVGGGGISDKVTQHLSVSDDTSLPLRQARLLAMSVLSMRYLIAGVDHVGRVVARVNHFSRARDIVFVLSEDSIPGVPLCRRPTCSSAVRLAGSPAGP